MDKKATLIRVSDLRNELKMTPKEFEAATAHLPKGEALTQAQADTIQMDAFQFARMIGCHPSRLGRHQYQYWQRNVIAEQIFTTSLLEKAAELHIEPSTLLNMAARGKIESGMVYGQRRFI